MPQSIQIVPKYSYPYVETVINDNTKVTETNTDTRIDPSVTYAFPFVSSKGVDNVFVRKTSYDSFVSTYGTSNYKKYGQPLMMPLALLRKPNTYVWGMRVMPENATYSNAVISLYYKADETNDTVKASERRFRMKFIVKFLEGISDVKTFNKKYVELDGTELVNDKYVDDEGYTQAPVMGIRVAGRGKYGDNYSVHIDTNKSYEKEYGIKMYDFVIMNNEGGLNKIATYTGSIVSSSKYDASTLVNDILENSNIGDVPVYISMNEAGVEDVYDAYVSFLTELYPSLEAEYDETFAKYAEIFANVSISRESLTNMVNGNERVPTGIIAKDADGNDVKLSDAVSELQKIMSIIKDSNPDNIIDIDEFDPFFAKKVASTELLPCIMYPSEVPKGGIPAGANPADYTTSKLMPSFGSVKGVGVNYGTNGYFDNPRILDTDGFIVTSKTVAVDAEGETVFPKEVEVPATIVKFVDSTDNSYYINSGTATIPVYTHYNADGTTVQVDVVTFATATSTTEGALEVVANDYTGKTVYAVATSGDTGALKVVADDADPFDSETQIKISDVTGITVNVGDYVTKTEVPFDPETQIKIGEVTGISVVVGDYVTKTVTKEDEVVNTDEVTAKIEAGELTRVEDVDPEKTVTVTKYYREDGVTEGVEPINTNASKYYYEDGKECTTDVTQWTVAQEIDECYKNAFNGTFDRKVLSSRRIPVTAWFDANYSYEVKQVLAELVVVRNDAPLYLDCGIEMESFSKSNINSLIRDYAIFSTIGSDKTGIENHCLISKNTQHFMVRETPSQKRVKVSITYFLAQQFADHVIDYGTHIPMVKAKAQLTGHIRDTLEPSIEDYEADLKEELYQNNFNYFETLDDNVFQRATQTTAQTDLTDLSEENNVFTLYAIKRIIETDIHSRLYDFADASEREHFSAFEKAKFSDWTGSKVLSIDIEFRVNKWEFDRSILHCYVAVVFRGLQKRAILEIDINKRTYEDSTNTDDNGSTTGTIML